VGSLEEIEQSLGYRQAVTMRITLVAPGLGSVSCFGHVYPPATNAIGGVGVESERS
jgi:hypothetical protein